MNYSCRISETEEQQVRQNFIRQDIIIFLVIGFLPLNKILNMLIQRSIMQHSLDRSDGQSASGCLIYPVGSFPGHIYRRKGCVIAEREPVGVGRLPMLKPRVLFCVQVKVVRCFS